MTDRDDRDWAFREAQCTVCDQPIVRPFGGPWQHVVGGFEVAHQPRHKAEPPVRERAEDELTTSGTRRRSR